MKELQQSIVEAALAELFAKGFAVPSEDGQWVTITELGWAQLEYEAFLQQDRKPS